MLRCWRRPAVEWLCNYVFSSASQRFTGGRHVSSPNHHHHINLSTLNSNSLSLILPLSLSPHLSNPIGLCSPHPLLSRSLSPLPVPLQTALLLGDWRGWIGGGENRRWGESGEEERAVLHTDESEGLEAAGSHRQASGERKGEKHSKHLKWKGHFILNGVGRANTIKPYSHHTTYIIGFTVICCLKYRQQQYYRYSIATLPVKSFRTPTHSRVFINLTIFYNVE